jgi:hypothetical protein
MASSLAEKLFHYDNNPKKGSKKEYSRILLHLSEVLSVKSLFISKACNTCPTLKK